MSDKVLIMKPDAHPDGASVGAVASYVAVCARGWEPGVRLLGNARAEDIARMAEWAMTVAPLIERLRNVYRCNSHDAHDEIESLLATDAAARGGK